MDHEVTYKDSVEERLALLGNNILLLKMYV